MERCCETSHVRDGEVYDRACSTFTKGANGRCVYCDHEKRCHGRARIDTSKPEGSPLGTQRTEPAMEDETGGEQAGRVHVYGDGTGKFDWLSHFRKRDGKLTHLATLPGGMLSGKASVVIVGKLKDGSYAVLQTSLRIMLDACASWMTAFGVEADGSRMPPPTDATRERINTALMLKLIREREGGEVTVSVAEINDIMSDSTQDVSIEYAADGKSLTLRTRTND